MTETAPAITASDDEIAAAVAQSEVTPLVVAVALLTGDRSILDEAVRPDPANMMVPELGFTETDFATSRGAVVRALGRYRDAGCPPAPVPTDDDIDELVDWMTGGTVPAEQMPMFREEIDARDEDLRSPGWSKAQVAPDRQFRVAIIGAGMSGLAAAHRLGQAGVDHVVIEKNDDVGGTWLENTYPGCRVDVPTFFYSYSFAQRGDWPETYATQDVLLDYFRDCADRFDLRRRIRFSTEVTSMAWDEARCLWVVELLTPTGEETLEVEAVVSAVGQLNRPKYPDIAGIETFAGTAFHSARWDHSVDLTGKRVGVIGTGCSGAQFIPVVAEQAGHLTVFQRTPNWLAPSPTLADAIAEGTQWLFTHVPAYRHTYRLFQFWRLAEGMLIAAKVDPTWDDGGQTVSEINAFVRELFLQHLRDTFADRPDLLAQVTPDYPPIAKRIVRDDGTWAATLSRDDVELESGPIEAVTPTGVRTADGVDHPCDVLIYGTGFQAADFLMPMKVTGVGGVDLHDAWDGDARAYLGITMPGFPNLFCLYGPNTNIVINGSIIFFSEAEVHYLLRAVHHLLDTGLGAIDCRPEVHDAYNERIDDGNRTMAWGASDVSSWYKNAHGRVAQNWPFSLFEYWAQTRELNPDDFLPIKVP